MKILICLFLTVVCVHCIPLHEDDKKYDTEKQHMGNNDTIDPNLVDRIKFMDSLSLVGKLDFVPDFMSYNKSNATTSERPADATPTTYPLYSGYINCADKCILNQPPLTMQNSPWAMHYIPWPIPNSPSAMQYIPSPIPNSPSAMQYIPSAMQYIPSPIPNSPSAMQYIPSPISNSPSAMQYIPWPMQNSPLSMQYIPWPMQYSPLAMQYIPWPMQNSPWAMPNNPSLEPDNQWGIPNNQLDTSTSLTYSTSTDASNGKTNDTTQQNPSYDSTTELIPL